jgi:DNA-binding HxlR family transcriptional regulator
MTSWFGCRKIKNRVLIVWHLAYGPLRFGELRRRLAHVNEKVLIGHLRELEADDIVARTTNGMQPLQVTYSLSAVSKELLPGLALLCNWGTRRPFATATVTLPKGVLEGAAAISL